MATDTPDHIRRNRGAWDTWATEYEEAGRGNWAQDEPSWGQWSVPESTLRMFPDEVSGLDTIELGCGTAYVSSWLARRGARAVGIDNSTAQLANARRFQAEFGLSFPLIHGDAEQTPFADESFDLAISEYGASIWCDPYRWIPEAARLLRPGGRLVFLCNGAFLMCCLPDVPAGAAGDRLVRPYIGMHRFEWSDDDSVEFHLGHGVMHRLLRDSGFVVDELIEVEIPEGAHSRHVYVPDQWARQWPAEEVWKAHRITGGT
ncbi:MAG TPA: class I SAM-dependent methyltransferase [Acidimicrobiales bacterium]|jgi:SAM-dependent methyltransferase